MWKANFIHFNINFPFLNPFHNKIVHIVNNYIEENKSKKEQYKYYAKTTYVYFNGIMVLIGIINRDYIYPHVVPILYVLFLWNIECR